MRLRRIRFKDGRAPIEVLRTPMNCKSDYGDENLLGAVLKCAKKLGDFETPAAPLDGFIVMGFYADNTRSLGFRIPKRISREMLPHYVAEIIRTDAITDREAAQVFDDKFEWRDA